MSLRMNNSDTAEGIFSRRTRAMLGRCGRWALLSLVLGCSIAQAGEWGFPDTARYS